jgi:hypothetical protein
MNSKCAQYFNPIPALTNNLLLTRLPLAFPADFSFPKKEKKSWEHNRRLRSQKLGTQSMIMAPHFISEKLEK